MKVSNVIRVHTEGFRECLVSLTRSLFLCILFYFLSSFLSFVQDTGHRTGSLTALSSILKQRDIDGTRHFSRYVQLDGNQEPTVNHRYDILRTRRYGRVKVQLYTLYIFH